MYTFARNSMDILKMSAKVATLSEGFLAKGTLKGAHTCMFAEMVTEVAAFLEDTAALRILALEVQLDSLGFGVFDSDGLMPLLGNALEGLMFVSS